MPFQWPWSPKPQPAPVVPEVLTVVRLEESQLEALRTNLGGAAFSMATHQTTEIQAGFMLGVQHVLTVLQKGYTISRPKGYAG